MYSAKGSGFYFYSHVRLSSILNPTYDCVKIDDSFTSSRNTGNGKLSYPVALISSKEIIFAGGVNSTAFDTYLTYNSTNQNDESGSSTGSSGWWTISPCAWSNGSIIYFLEGLNNLGYLDNSYSDGSRAVRPVTSLKSCVKWSSGDGSADSPYEIVLDGGC